MLSERFLNSCMKILIPIIKGNSGNDTYFQYLNDALGKRDVSVDIKYLSHYLELFPYFAKAILLCTSDLKSYALVHTNADYGSCFKISGRPFVVTMHHNVFDGNYQKYTSTTQKLYHNSFLKRRIYEAFKSADKIIAVSMSTKISLENTFSISDVDVIYNGIDTDRFQPKHVCIPEEFFGKIKLLFVGNLTRRKGADLLPKIMKELGQHYILFYTSGLRTKTTFYEPNMISLGRMTRGKLVEIYNSCDIFLLPSRLEGFGYAAAEAMACGKPVVCTNCSSLPELLVDQKSGFLCEQDNVEDFVEKIKVLGESEKLRESMGEFNRQRILENFTVQKMAENYLRIYKDILKA